MSNERILPPSAAEFVIDEREHLRTTIEQQAWEIEWLNREAKNDAIAYKAAIERQGELRDEIERLKSDYATALEDDWLRAQLNCRGSEVVGEVRCDGDMVWQVDGDPAVWRRLGEGTKLYAQSSGQE